MQHGHESTCWIEMKNGRERAARTYIKDMQHWNVARTWRNYKLMHFSGYSTQYFSLICMLSPCPPCPSLAPFCAPLLTPLLPLHGMALTCQLHHMFCFCLTTMDLDLKHNLGYMSMSIAVMTPSPHLMTPLSRLRNLASVRYYPLSSKLRYLLNLSFLPVKL